MLTSGSKAAESVTAASRKEIGILKRVIILLCIQAYDGESVGGWGAGGAGQVR